MKDEEYYQNLEARFQERDSQLLTHLSMSDEEENLIFPALESLTDDAPRYADFRFVAEGGEKTIEAAFDRIAQREVAFARPREKGGQFFEHFLKEARITAYLEHPNIMPVYDIGFSDEAPYFTMELIQGENLGEKRGATSLEPTDLDHFIEDFIKVCDAVSFAHSKGVVHLDIKPSNIQTGLFGEVLLSDWGLCRVLGEESLPQVPEKLSQDLIGDLTICGKLRGTPGYMSPSLASGEIGGKSDDIYALGATLYYILCGTCPHFSEDTKEILAKTLKEEVIKPIDCFPNLNIPIGLQSIAMKALDRDAPYDSVADLRSDLVHYLRGYAPSAEDASFLKIITLLYRRQRALCHTFLGALLLIVSMTVFFMLSLKKGQDDEARARLKAEHSLEMYESELRLNQYLMEGMDQSLKAIIAELNDKDLSLDIQEVLVRVGRNRIDGKTYEAAAQMLETLAGETTGQSHFDALHDLTFIKIFTHDFSGALELLESLPEKELNRAALFYFIPVCQDFRNKPKVNGLLNLKDLLSLVERVKKHPRTRAWFFSHLFSYYLRKCHEEEDVEEFLEVVLKKHLDKACKGARLTEEGGQRTLSFIEGESYNRIAVPALLEKLGIDYLNLSGTAFRNLSFIQNLDFQKINLVNSPIKNLSPLKDVISLREVILQKGKSYSFIDELRERGVKVTYSKFP